MLVILARGPHCQRYTWLGYEGGYSVKKKKVETKDVEKHVQPEENGVQQSSERSEEKSM